MQENTTSIGYPFHNESQSLKTKKTFTNEIFVNNMSAPINMGGAHKHIYSTAAAQQFLIRMSSAREEKRKNKIENKIKTYGSNNNG